MNRQAYALLLATALFWGANAVAGKLAVGHISPMVLTFIRWALTLAFVAAIGWRQVRRDWPVLRAHLPLLAGLGAAGFALFNAALYSALNYTSAINVSIEQAAIPMVIFIANFLLFRQRATLTQIIGFVISIVGVAVVASHGELSRLAALDVNLGDALMVLAVILYGGYTVALRYKPQVHWMSLMTIMSAAALVTSIPFVVFEAASGAALVPTPRGWAIALFTVLFPSILAQVFYMRGVELIGANRAGLFVNMVPVFGTLLSVLVLAEAFHAYHAVALGLVLGGIWLAETSGRRQPA
jgi:drug/metabolite transporter (DMT)-like permease